jgi:signal peptidase I
MTSFAHTYQQSTANATNTSAVPVPTSSIFDAFCIRRAKHPFTQVGTEAFGACSAGTAAAKVGTAAVPGAASAGATFPNRSSIFRGLPTTQQIKDELLRERHRNTKSSILRNTIFLFMIAAAAAILVVTLWMPVLRVYGTSMNPTFTDGNVVISLKTSSYAQGDVVAFYYNNKILVKRVIATGGQTVDIDEDGVVTVDGQTLDEPYVEAAAQGDCDITFPYTVPDSRVFVLGDNRSVSVDSRSNQVGCVSDEQIVGRLIFRVWPLNELALY